MRRQTKEEDNNCNQLHKKGDKRGLRKRVEEKFNERGWRWKVKEVPCCPSSFIAHYPVQLLLIAIVYFH